MKTFEEVKQQLLQVQPRLQQVYQVTEVGIFGSYARKEQTETSDVDVLIDYHQAPTLFKLVELREYLGTVLGMEVDVVKVIWATIQEGLPPLKAVIIEIINSKNQENV